MTQAILFDYGGTLDGAGSHWFDRFIGLYRGLGVARPAEEIKLAFYAADKQILADPRVTGWGLKEMMREHIAIQLSALELERADLAAALLDRFLFLSHSAWRLSGRVLGNLAARFELGVVSNFYGNLRQILKEAELGHYFATVADSAVVGLSKPDRGIFEYAMKELNVLVGNSTFVGDSFERDMVPAKSLGMRTIWIAEPERSCPQPALVDWRISSLTELERLSP